MRNPSIGEYLFFFDRRVGEQRNCRRYCVVVVVVVVVVDASSDNNNDTFIMEAISKSKSHRERERVKNRLFCSCVVLSSSILLQLFFFSVTYLSMLPNPK